MKRAALVATIVAMITAMFSTVLGQATPPSSRQQDSKRTLAERLGYPREGKLLIVHADDLGMAHSINAAYIKAFESGLVSSGSIMVPCPWLPEIASYARSHPQADLGLHLTLTSEWSSYRWGPVLAKDRVNSLFDKSGYLYPTETEAAAHIDAREAEAEIRAQIERARAFGIQPTHLDSHMGTLYQNKMLFETLLRVARDNKLPVRISKEWFASPQFPLPFPEPDVVVIDRIISIEPTVAPADWAKFYTEAIKGLQPGVTEMIVHIAYDDEEMRAATFDHPDWGAAWRQRDFEFLTSDGFRKLLQENNVKLISWRDVGRIIGKVEN